MFYFVNVLYAVGGAAIFQMLSKNMLYIQHACLKTISPGFWYMPKFLINIYHMYYTSMICIKRGKCAQTLKSEYQNMMKWVEPAFENQYTQRRRIEDSCLVISFCVWWIISMARDHLLMIRRTWYVRCCSSRSADQRKSPLARHQAGQVDTQCHQSPRVAIFKSRVCGPVGGGFMWKCDHDLKLVE